MINGRDTAEKQWSSSPEVASQEKRGFDPEEGMGEKSLCPAINAF